MSIHENERLDESIQLQTKGTILWLSGWSIPSTVFNQLCRELAEFRHLHADYSTTSCPTEITQLVETSVKKLLPFNKPNYGTPNAHVPLLIGGWSLGGLLALQLAAKGLADGLVLFGANARFVRTKQQSTLGWADSYIKRMITGLQKDRKTIEDAFRQRLLADMEVGFRANLPPGGCWTTAALIAGLQILRSEDCSAQLADIACPVLLVHGTADTICPYGAAEELYAQLPQAELLALPGCGHTPFVGRESYIADAIRRWWL